MATLVRLALLFALTWILVASTAPVFFAGDDIGPHDDRAGREEADAAPARY